MANSGKSRKSGEGKETERLRKRFQEMFSGDGEPVSHLSLTQVEALQSRLAELEAQVAHAGKDLTSHEVPSSEVGDQLLTGQKYVMPVSSASSAPEAQKAGKLGWIANFWDRLTLAHADIKDTGDRQQAQLAAAISLGSTTLVAAGFVGSLLVNRSFTITVGFLLILSAITLVAYFIARSRFFKVGSAALVLSLFASGYALAVFNSGRVSSSLFSLIPLGFILGSIFLPLWGLAVLTGANFVVILMLPSFIPGYVDAITDGGIYLTLGTLLVIAVAFRNAVERSRVGEIATTNRELQAIRANLELRVQDRTHDLELASEVGRTVTEKVADLQNLLTDAAELIRDRFDLYYTQVYLADSARQKLVLRAGTGDVGRELLRRRHQLRIDASSLNGRAAMEGKPVIVADTSQNPSFLPNPLLPKTRSEMAVPLQVGERVIGVLDMQSEQPGALNEFNLPAFEALAGQLAIAIQNASLFDDSRQARAEVEAQFRRQTEQGWREFLNSIDRSERIGYRFEQSQAVPLESSASSLPPAELDIPITIAGAEIGKIQSNSPGRAWSEQELQVLKSTAAQLSQHLENLRLIAQSESFRDQAEQAVRRLTREGWSQFAAENEQALGFLYDLNSVALLSGSNNGHSQEGLSQPLVVQNELIGELTAGIGSKSEQAAGIIAAVAQQLSTHIETLRLAEELQQRATELQELDRLKTAFLANMSHELRTPLNSILGFADVMLEEIDGPLTDTMRNDLQLIQKNGNHLLHLINDVLDMAKIEAGKMNLSPEPFKLQEVLEDVISIGSPQAGDKHIHLTIGEASDQQLEVTADRTRIRQVLLNLVSNAIKFTDQGSVELCALDQGEHALISVRDTGEGIPPDKLESIFQEFTQVDTSTTRKVGGTGLGLPISRRLIEMHGGRMWAESQGIGAGNGSIFFVELPVESRITDPIEAHDKQTR